ncbi:FdhF/YdeP family oxidoreductase [Halioxenophilus aromaticivorans]|uniref:FdhF/YdeP family oxidoreductase n=1 Tax=Halioxenophilus aromaticivorans TaxID=1306992 RepID=A0AAV3U1B3_9ALTE
MSHPFDAAIVGGGVKKILTTLHTVRRMGIRTSARALNANNACKACGLGMGGQRGGMTNELGEFPSVCNKSVQAQSSDNRPAIPEAIFDHPIDEFKKLSGWEMESLGRLNTPLIKRAGAQHYTPTSWAEALRFAGDALLATQPQRSFFYASGRSSNEAGFVLQLMARLFGTNNVNNCSYYCHQATAEGLANSIGSGTATVELADLSGCDFIFVIGANPASNHPRFIHQLQACRQRGGQVIVINPAKEPGLVRFAVPKSVKSLIAGGSEIASDYLQPKIGTDLALFTALGKAVLELRGEDQAYIDAYTTHFVDYRSQCELSDWDDLCTICGVSKQAIFRVAKAYCKAKRAVFAWGMGITQHQNGVDNIEAIANLALMRGMVGNRYCGLLPLRGHSNVQGIGTIGVVPVLTEVVFDNLEKHLQVTLPSQPGLDTLACLEAASRGEMDSAVLMGGNLYEASPDSRWAQTALNKIGFKCFLTTTLNRGHVHGVEDGDVVILPVTARDEEWHATTQESMFNFVRLSDGGIERFDNVRPETEILCDLANRCIEHSAIDFHQFKSHGNVRKAIAATVPGMELLADIDIARHEFHVKNRLLHKPKFHTANKRARFTRHCWDPALLNNEQFPFRLMSVRSEGQFNSTIYEQCDTYRGADKRWLVMLNPKDMANADLAAGDFVHLHSPYGTMRDVEIQPFDLPCGNVMAYYPEANVLVGRERDPRSQTPAFKSVAVAIEVALRHSEA